MQATLCDGKRQLSDQIVRAEFERFTHPGPMDRKSISDHFADLTPLDLRFRFGSPVSQAWAACYASGILERTGQVLAAWSDGNIYALGELRPASGGPKDECEIGLSVLKPFRNQGHGTALLNALLENAKATGFAYAHLQILHENRPMQRICKGKQAKCTRFGPELIYSFSIGPSQVKPLVV